MPEGYRNRRQSPHRHGTISTSQGVCETDETRQTDLDVINARAMMHLRLVLDWIVPKCAKKAAGGKKPCLRVNRFNAHWRDTCANRSGLTPTSLVAHTLATSEASAGRLISVLIERE